MRNIYPDATLVTNLLSLVTPSSEWHIWTGSAVPDDTFDLNAPPAGFAEASYPAYAPLVLDPAQWVGATGSGLGSIVQAMVAFPINDSGGDVNVNGYYALNQLGGFMVIARFDAVQVVPNGVAPTIVPILASRDCGA